MQAFGFGDAMLYGSSCGTLQAVFVCRYVLRRISRAFMGRLFLASGSTPYNASQACRARLGRARKTLRGYKDADRLTAFFV